MFRKCRFSFFLFFAVVLLAACGHPEGPKPLTLQEIPPALKQSFRSAALLVRQNAESIGKLVEEKQYAAATIQLQALMPQTLSDEQREIASAAFQTLNTILQEQAASFQPTAETESPAPAAKPDTSREEAAAAAAVLDHYVRTK